jgi:DUF2914 family protein
MKRSMILAAILWFFLAGAAYSAEQAAPAAPPASVAAGKPAPEAATAAAPKPLLVLSRMEICREVSDRKPVGAGTSFPASQDSVSCFLEFGGAQKETSVTVVWTHGLMEMGRTSLPVRRHPMFRTWSSRSIGGMKGDWKVDVLDEKGAVLKTTVFKVE